MAPIERGAHQAIIVLIVTPEFPEDPSELVQRVANGDQEAFMRLYDLFADKVYGLALYILKTPQAAEEVSQETFVKLWTSADSFRPDRGRFSSWLLTIARRTAIDRIRRLDRRPNIADGLDIEADWNADLRQPGSGGEEARWRTMYFALQELPEEQRQAIVLSYYHGLSHSEIATHLGIPLGTAKTRIRLGMQKLRDRWLDPGPDTSKLG